MKLPSEHSCHGALGYPGPGGLGCLPHFLSEPWVEGQGLLLLRDPHHLPCLEPKSPFLNKVLTANALVTFLEGLGTPRERARETQYPIRSLAVDSGTSVSLSLSEEGELVYTLASGMAGSRAQILIQNVFPSFDFGLL